MLTVDSPSLTLPLTLPSLYRRAPRRLHCPLRLDDVLKMGVASRDLLRSRLNLYTRTLPKGRACIFTKCSLAAVCHISFLSLTPFSRYRPYVVHSRTCDDLP